MKFNHKLMVVSAAVLIGAGPVVSGLQTTTVQAAKKATTNKTTSKKGTIQFSHNAYVYDKNGKRLKKYMGSAKYTTIAKGITVNYTGKKTINGTLYYGLGNGAFVKAGNVGYVDGQKVTTSTPATSTVTATLKSNAYIYDANGKTDKKKIKKGAKVTVDQLIYIGSKLYYRISGQSNQFIKSSNVASTSAKLKPVNTKPEQKPSKPADNTNQTGATVITLGRNAYIYDGQGNTNKKLVKKGQQVTVDQLKYIGSKLYYRINDSNYPGKDQWIKKSNVSVVTGSQLKPENSQPAADDNATIITLGRDSNVYNAQGVAQKNNTFPKGHTARVTELRYIWVTADNKAELFYALQSDKNGYIKDDDVSGISGAKLTPVNTPQAAQEAITVATATDKGDLQTALNQDSTVKSSDTYKLSAKSLRDAYDTASSDASQVNSSQTATIGQVKDALAKLTAAKSALNGKKVVVTDLNNLTVAEGNQIVQLVASVNDVATSAVQFSNNNTTLTISGANGFQQTLNIADYATTAK
ncbi:SLAP domain-containing protein [Lactobacillus sp. ESL0701]|uniref:SLAP domain-containing protein n=1 Tax=Lactobacillus sp. ESL0701 TaxID=2983217 RepID=UPI0023F911D0|nr:SLAP domain-containing protein [Lactobacillus sp. ESL0701]MDF7672559.1 SLAP domain-containing protein [Lactobacillus sp. ESL0701]